MRGGAMKVVYLCYAAIGFAIARWVYRRRPVVDPVPRLRARGLL